MQRANLKRTSAGAYLNITGDVFEYGTHVWIDLLKFYTTSYGTDFFTSEPLYFWMTFGGFGSSSNPGQGFSGQYVFYCWACVSS